MGSETDVVWIQCPYFGFWDVPRDLLLPYKGRLFELDSPFEEEGDDYRPSYFVWELADVAVEQAETLSSVQRVERRIKQWKNLPVEALEFDSKRERHDGRSYVWLRFRRPYWPFPEVLIDPAE